VAKLDTLQEIVLLVPALEIPAEEETEEEIEEEIEEERNLDEVEPQLLASSVEEEDTLLVIVPLEAAIVHHVINAESQVTLLATALRTLKRLDEYATIVEAKVTLPENATTMRIPTASDVDRVAILQEIVHKRELMLLLERVIIVAKLVTLHAIVQNLRTKEPLCPCYITHALVSIMVISR